MKRRSGASAVEFALVASLLFVVLFGLMDWSWYMYHWLTVTSAAGRGARIAAGVKMADDPTGMAQTAATDWLRSYAMRGTPVVVADIQNRGYSKILHVQITVPFDPLVGLVPTPPQLRGSAEVLWYGDREQ